MRYGIQRLGVVGWFVTSLSFEFREERDKQLRYLRNRRESEAQALRPIRILSAAEAKRKAQAEKLRERAAELQAMPEAKHPENDRDYDRGVAYGLRCAARLLNAEADKLWPRKRGG